MIQKATENDLVKFKKQIVHIACLYIFIQTNIAVWFWVHAIFELFDSNILVKKPSH